MQRRNHFHEILWSKEIIKIASAFKWCISQWHWEIFLQWNIVSNLREIFRESKIVKKKPLRGLCHYFRKDNSLSWATIIYEFSTLWGIVFWCVACLLGIFLGLIYCQVKCEILQIFFVPFFLKPYFSLLLQPSCFSSIIALMRSSKKKKKTLFPPLLLRSSWGRLSMTLMTFRLIFLI